MLEETIVFSRNKGLDQLFRDFIDRNRRAPLLAEFSDQRSVLAVDAQGNLHTYIAQHIDIRQVGNNIKDRKDAAGDKNHQQRFE